MGVTGVAACDSGNCERKGKGYVHRITVGTEANTAACKSVHELKCGIFARFPSSPDTERSLANIDVTRAIAAVTVATVDARSTDEAIQALFDGGHRVTGFN